MGLTFTCSSEGFQAVDASRRGTPTALLSSTMTTFGSVIVPVSGEASSGVGVACATVSACGCGVAAGCGAGVACVAACAPVAVVPVGVAEGVGVEVVAVGVEVAVGVTVADSVAFEVGAGDGFATGAVVPTMT